MTIVDIPVAKRPADIDVIAPKARALAQSIVRAQVGIMELNNILMEASIRSKNVYQPREDLIEDITALNDKLEALLKGGLK